MRKRDAMSNIFAVNTRDKILISWLKKFDYFLMYTFIILITCQENWVKQFNMLLYKWENGGTKSSKNRVVEV